MKIYGSKPGRDVVTNGFPRVHKQIPHTQGALVLRILGSLPIAASSLR